MVTIAARGLSVTLGRQVALSDLSASFRPGELVGVLGQPEAFIHFKDELIGADGTIHNEGTHKFLQGYVDRFLKLIAVHAKGD